MSVKKMKWINLLGTNPNLIHPDILQSLLEECDSLFNSKLQTEEETPYDYTSLYDAYDSMFNDYLSDDEVSNLWKDMDIFISSFKENDQRIYRELLIRLTQYLGFYKRVLTDDGVARKIVSRRTYSGSSSSSGEYKNYESETPQVQLDNFDDAIDYASTLGKNVDTRSSSKEGESDYELKSFGWDEALKNMKMVFYNDLIKYINSIPLVIYNYFALDEYPVGESIALYLKTLKDLYAR